MTHKQSAPQAAEVDPLRICYPSRGSYEFEYKNLFSNSKFIYVIQGVPKTKTINFIENNNL